MILAPWYIDIVPDEMLDFLHELDSAVPFPRESVKQVDYL